ncbi:hypothetical protein Glove_585g38 [Diversispora epigaea]|uniref:DUF659 domain-containing protein n=1 Tax=Diversispora epigaea TaxID=1348612 RepID=A0A397GBV4_9GLOM|nr:hypothetical protein Glove_585g38 [Diversispora epigaea]
MSKNLSNQLVVTWTCPTIKIRCPMSGGHIKFLTMAPLPAVIEEFIIKTNEKLNKSNLKVYCKPCVKVLGEIEGKKTKPSFSCEMASIVSQGSKVIVRSSSYGTIENYIVRPLSSSDMKKFHTLLLKLSLSCGWVLHWVNKPEAEELFQFLNPHLKLPDRRLLGGHILSDAVIDSNNMMIEVLQKDPVGVTLTFDGWTNVRNEQLLGVKATNISSERETHIEVMEKTKEMYTELNDNGVKVCAVVTDSAGPYAASRRRLRVINRLIVFFSCFAHQILAIKFEPPIRETRKRAGDEPTLKRDIYEIISSSIFWQHLKLLIEILYPYCKILDILQSDKARLHEVIHSFGYIAQFWNENFNSDLASRLVARLEKRWKEWEQPILIISCLLHPNYHMKIFNNANINYTTIGQHSKCIPRELKNFRLELYPFNLATWNQFNGDIYRYWSFACASTNELGFVACRVFGICVNAASVERLWSCMGFLQSNRCNRLSNTKALEIKEIVTNENEQTIEQGDVKILSYGSQDLFLSEEIDEEMEITNEESNDLEDDFENYLNYLQEWINMLEDEKKSMDELEEINNNETENITYPAIDLNAKWELSTLFNKLNLPF